MRSRLLSIIISSVLSGCALMDTGEIEYRRAQRPSGDIQATIATADRWREGHQCIQEPAEPGEDFDPRTEEPQDPSARYSRWACYPLFRANLWRRNASNGDPIQVGQFYSIRVEHAVIANMIEDAFSFRRLMNERNPFRRVGEVAILAHTFEFAESVPGEGTEAATTQFVNISSLEGVKVIYFNPDVEEGQALNFSNIVLRESTEYHGRPIGIQIVVIELDRMSGPMRSLMRTLATLGERSAALPSGPAADALLQLGASIISQNNDDVMFEYRFVLDPYRPDSPLQTSPFEAGRYVIRRINERRRMQRWDDLILDHNTGQLLQTAGGGRFVPFERDTYFTLSVVREQGAFYYGGQTLRELGTEIETAAAARDAPFEALRGRLENALAATRNRELLRQLRDSWTAAATAYREYANHYADPALVSDQCTLTNSANRNRARDEAMLQGRTRSEQFLSLYRRAQIEREEQVARDADTELFSDEVQRSFLARLAAFFGPFDEADKLKQEHLTDPALFRSAFVADLNAFHEAAVQAAQTKWAARTCEALRESGLAEQAEGATDDPEQGTDPPEG